MNDLARPPVGVPVSAKPDLAVGLRRVPWEHVAFVGVGLLAAVLYLWDLTISGWGNEYYSAAAQAAALDWKAWFFGSVDPANWITVDKPPLATMLMGLSVRLFGLSSFAVLLPQAVMGVATVLVTFHLVRRSFGVAAATIAGVVMALTPIAVLIFRYNNPDALLTLLLVLSAWTAMRAIEAGSVRWVFATAVLVGLGFLTKYLQAYLVVPAFAITWLLFAVGSLRQRFWGLVVAGVGLVVASGWWVAVVEMIPASDRPYIGGSQSNSALELLLGYDGLQRVFGFFGRRGPGGPPGGFGGPPGGGGLGGGGGFSGEPGLVRLFNDQLGGQIAWLLPLAIVGLVAALWIRRRAARTDAPRAAVFLWGAWLATHALVFSFMSGIIHSYYTVAMAPAIAALVGIGVVDLWRARGRAPWAGAVLGGGLVVTALVGAVLLARTPAFVPWLGPLAVIAALVVGAGLALPWVLAEWPEIAAAAVGVGLVAVLVGPAAYALDTVGTAFGGGDPSAGPAGGNGPGGGPGGPGGPAVGPDGLGGVGGANAALLDYLVANRGSATWLIAVSSANEAAPIQLASGAPVLAMGGFSGSDPAMTTDRLEGLVASRRLRFVLVGGPGGPGGFFGGGPGGARGGSSVSSWVVAHCTPVRTVAVNLYDCATP